MPLLEHEKEGWHEVEIALDNALCNFCNQASDAFEPVDEWNEYVQKDLAGLCKAYNDWYSWKLTKNG